MALFRSFATVGGATLASRVLGFVREMLIATLLGAGPVADAFYAAFSVPNLFRRFLAEGAFNSAFVPLFAKEYEQGGFDQAKQFATSVFSVLVAVLITLTALLELFMPQVIDAIVPGFRSDDDKRALTIEAARIMMPYLFCLSLVAMLSGVLNTFRKYFLAAFAPVLLNVILIGVLLSCLWLGTGNSALTGRLLAWGVFAAGLAQLLLLMIGTRRAGFTMQLKLPKLTPQVRELLILAAPTALAAGIVQINLFVGRIIASPVDGAIATLTLADRIYQLPLGVVGIAIGVVLLPELSRALKADDQNRAAETQNRSLEFGLFLTLPAAAALAIIPEPIIRVLYEHGAFTSEDTLRTAQVLAAFALGLPSFVLIKIFSPGYFAREDTRTPMVFAGVGAIVNIALSLLLFPTMGVVGIALATTIAGWVNALCLYAVLQWKGHWTFDRGFVQRAPLIVVSCVVMSAALVALYWAFERWTLEEAGLPFHITALVLLVSGGGLAYLAASIVTGAADRAALRRALKRT